jgi:hypothetical protein
LVAARSQIEGLHDIRPTGATAQIRAPRPTVVAAQTGRPQRPQLRAAAGSPARKNGGHHHGERRRCPQPPCPIVRQGHDVMAAMQDSAQLAAHIAEPLM